MSRIGKAPISLPAGVTLTVNKGSVTVKGPKGELVQEVHPDITVKVEGETVTLERPTEQKKT